jgi:hypothetical protein
VRPYAQEARDLALLLKVRDLLWKLEISQTITIVGEKHFLAFEVLSTALSRWPILELMPVSANVIRQSCMSELSSCTSFPPPDKTKSLEAHSL